MNIDHMDALDELETAYDLLEDFLATIQHSLDGDHPSRDVVEAWLVRIDNRKTTGE